MKFSRTTGRASRSIDDAILPLTNVVFLLLIFFMLTGQLVSPAPFDTQPPQSRSQGHADARGVDVLMSADGALAVDGDTVTRAGLAAAVKRHLKAQPNAPLSLRADARTPSARVVAVMHVLHDAGAHRLRLITLASQP